MICSECDRECGCARVVSIVNRGAMSVRLDPPSQLCAFCYSRILFDGCVPEEFECQSDSPCGNFSERRIG